MPDEKTLAVYDTEAEAYADLFEPSRAYPLLERFIAALPEGGRVLDLGCGPGTWAARMVARGLEVDALDASPGMAEEARRRYGLDVCVASFDDVTAEAIYDGIWAHYSLLHAPRSALPRHFAALARALRPDGCLVLAMKLGEGEARDRRDRFYTYVAEDELMGLLDTAGFAVLSRKTGEDTGFDGSPHRYIALIAQRR